jgi:hypothetical protein
MIGQLFVQIYPNSACAPMHAWFAECYRNSSPEELPARKPAAMAAVAGTTYSAVG